MIDLKYFAAALAGLWGICLSSPAQQPDMAAAFRQAGMMENIAAASARMKTLVCDFTQERSVSMLDATLISRGKLYYRNEPCLHWEYRDPYTYTFVLNRSGIMTGSGGGTARRTDISSSRLMQEIVKVMLSGIDGSGLQDDGRFSFRYMQNSGLWQVEMRPVQKELKQFFAVIRLTFNSQDYTVDRVDMEEAGGDVTSIVFANKQFNVPVPDELFRME